MELNFRRCRILAAIIEAYIHTGEPVGSKVLAEMQESMSRLGHGGAAAKAAEAVLSLFE